MGERQNLLKLFFALQITSLVMGAAVASLARVDLLFGVGLGFGIGSVNFGVSLTMSSKPYSRRQEAEGRRQKEKT
jgi:hypothetical protein